MWLYNVVDEIGRDITKNIYIKNNKTLKNLIKFYIVTKIFLPPHSLSDNPGNLVCYDVLCRNLKFHPSQTENLKLE